MSTPTGSALMERLVSLCKRRGFIFQSSEIYGGINGFWDYGPLGVELKNNLRDAWWDVMVHHPPAGPDGREIEIVGVDCSIISHPKVWEASGHVGGFSDPMQTCRVCKRLFRADHVKDLLDESGWVKSIAEDVGPAAFSTGGVHTSQAELKADENRKVGEALVEWARKKGKKAAPGLALVRNVEGLKADVQAGLYD